jgi:hypothetical protein
MGKISEESLFNWTKPPSDSEESKLLNSERMIKEAIDKNDKTNKLSIEVFGQGSYANDTNVRLNSDIDINVRYTGGFYFDLPKETTEQDVGIADYPKPEITYSEYKNVIEKALVDKFNRESVVRKNKCITVLGNSYRIETDVTPTWNFRRYSKDGSYVLGAKIITDSLESVINYPKQHIENGKEKNRITSRRFKRLTRIFKKLRYKMIEDGKYVSDNITSFLLECLIWNVPNTILNNNDTWSSRLKYSIIDLYEKTSKEDNCKEWGEVSELLYLFRPSRKWTREDVNAFMVQAWNFLELNK